MNKPLDKEFDLEDPTSSVVNLLLWIYSSSSYVESTINLAIRGGDELIVSTLGPFSAAFYQIIAGAGQWREDIVPEDFETSNLYRCAYL